MRTLITIFATLIVLSSAHADFSIFNSDTTVFTTSNELTANDRGLICVGYTKEQCDQADFQLYSGGGSTDGSVGYEVRYTLAGYKCRAYIEKSIFPGHGWYTSSMKSGQNCSQQ